MSQARPGATKCRSFAASSRSRPSESMKLAWKTSSMPWRTHCFTDSAERAWAARRLPRIFVSAAAIATSSSVIGVNSAGSPAMYSPERFSLIVSTPYLRNMRTVLRISSGPLTIAPKLNSG